MMQLAIVQRNKHLLSYDWLVSIDGSYGRAENKSILYPIFARWNVRSIYKKNHLQNLARIENRIRDSEHYCRCGHVLTKYDGYRKCKKCGFSTEKRLLCRSCLSNRVIKLNKRTNKCLDCGCEWSYKQIKHSKLINGVVIKFRQFKKQYYLNKSAKYQEKHDRFVEKYFVVRNKLGEFY